MGEAPHLELTGDETLVLFDFLQRFDDTGSLTISDQAEERVLWKLHGQLQKRLVEIFDPEYNELLAAARRRVGTEWEDGDS